MTDYTFTISEELYNKVKRIADASSESVDDVIRMRLENAMDNPSLTLPPDERAMLEGLRLLSDDPLWAIAREQMAATKQNQMQDLMDKNTQGTITSDEYTLLSGLVEQGQQLTLRKSEAMKILIERGHSITLDDLKPSDE